MQRTDSSPGFLGGVRATFRRPGAGKREAKGGATGGEGAHSLPPLVREPLDLFSLNAKTAAAASAAKMASDDAIARITPSSPPAQPKGGGNMRRQLATSADAEQQSHR